MHARGLRPRGVLGWLAMAPFEVWPSALSDGVDTPAPEQALDADVRDRRRRCAVRGAISSAQWPWGEGLADRVTTEGPGLSFR